MMKKGYENRYQVEMISIEDLVPQEHLLRQISCAVDFSKTYEFVEELYRDDNGRPSIDPVVLFKNGKTIDKIFAWILSEAAQAGYLKPEAVFIDGTHIKANANTKKKIGIEVPIAAKRYANELLEEN